VVHPCFDRKLPGSDLVDDELRSPEVVVELGKGCGLPLALRRVSIKQARGNVIVSVAEDRRSHCDDIVHNSFGGVAATVYGWLDLFDDNSFTTFSRLHCCEQLLANI
jgi:hypothetical protein